MTAISDRLSRGLQAAQSGDLDTAKSILGEVADVDDSFAPVGGLSPQTQARYYELLGEVLEHEDDADLADEAFARMDALQCEVYEIEAAAETGAAIDDAPEHAATHPPPPETTTALDIVDTTMTTDDPALAHDDPLDDEAPCSDDLALMVALDQEIASLIDEQPLGHDDVAWAQSALTETLEQYTRDAQGEHAQRHTRSLHAAVELTTHTRKEHWEEVQHREAITHRADPCGGDADAPDTWTHRHVEHISIKRTTYVYERATDALPATQDDPETSDAD